MSGGLYELLVSLTYPLYATFGLLTCGLLAFTLGWRRLGSFLVALAPAWSLVWSIPVCSEWLRYSLERQSPVVAEEKLPNADAVVVLGGGGSGRLATGARVWRAGRAPVVVLSGGRGGPHRSEARSMAAAITRFGVPVSAVLLEERSWNTRENAAFTAELAETHRIRRVLLVTSALHMPRASALFRRAGLTVIPVPVPDRMARARWQERWLPRRSASRRSGRALKEYLGLLALRVEFERER